jgi:hypothetical protein
VTTLVLAVAGAGPDIAVDASRLERVAARAAWRGPEPIDVCAALGLRPAEDAGADARVAVLRTPLGERALALPGRVALEELAAVVPLPALLASRPGARAILGVALPDAGRARVVVAPERLL